MCDCLVLTVAPCFTGHEDPVDAIHKIYHRILAGLFVKSKCKDIFLVFGYTIVYLCSEGRKTAEQQAGKKNDWFG